MPKPLQHIYAESDKLQIMILATDLNYASLLNDNLVEHGFIVDTTANMRLALERIRLRNYDLVLFDTGTAYASALQTLRDIREFNEHVPVLLLSGKNEKDMILDAYRYGCDEYVLTPVSVDVLVCKINSWIRRTKEPETDDTTPLQIGSFTFFPQEQVLVNGEDRRRLSNKQSRLLLLLAVNHNTIVERRIILRRVWKDDSVFAARSLSVFISQLRKILSDIDGVTIEGVTGKGYGLMTNK